MRTTRRRRRGLREAKRIGTTRDVQRLAGMVSEALGDAERWQDVHPSVGQAKEDLEMILQYLDDAIRERGFEGRSGYHF